MNKSIQSKMATFALAAGLIMGALPVSATPAGNTWDSRSKHVSLADLDLSTVEGMSAARERIHQAARRLCSEVSQADDLSRHSNFLKCVDDAMATTLPQVAVLANRNIIDRKVVANSGR